MKTILKLSLPVLLLGLLVAAADKPAGRIATIDLKRAFEKYYRHDIALKAVDGDGADLDKKLKSMQDEGQKMVEERDKLAKQLEDPMITAQEQAAIRTKLDAKTQEIQSKGNEIQTFKMYAQQNLDQKVKRVFEQLIQEIRVTVDARAKAGGYTLVVDTSAINGQLGSPIVIYSTGDNDLTDEVIKQINAAAPIASLPADPPKPGDKPDGKK
jgi:outer membrane protein